MTATTVMVKGVTDESSNGDKDSNKGGGHFHHRRRGRSGLLGPVRTEAGNPKNRGKANILYRSHARFPRGRNRACHDYCP